MIYIFDTSPLIHLFKNYYRNRFPSLWEKFDYMVQNGEIISVAEAYNEINIENANDSLNSWANINKEFFFHKPNDAELVFLPEIFKIKHFQELISQKAILTGRAQADPFIIAAGKCKPDACIVTYEGFDENGNVKPNAPKIPFICQHFKIPCCNLEQFMEKEDWTF